MLIRLKKAQSTAEYAILISLVVGAALAMQVYIKRSIQAKIKTAANALSQVSDDITGDNIFLDTTLLQYEPYYEAQKTAAINRSTNSTTNMQTLEGGAIEKDQSQDVSFSSNTTEQVNTSVLQE